MHKYIQWSLPSNVNAGSLASYDPHFLEEARRKRTVRGGGPPEPMEVDMETASLLDHDSVAENYERGAPGEAAENATNQGAPKFTTKATLQVNVDDALHFKDLDHVEKKHDIEQQISAKVLQTKYSVFIQDYGSMTEAPKKVDENGNALHQNTVSKAKKKKVQAEKNVMSSYSAEKLVGHRSDIINDVDKLVEFIGDGGAQNKANSHRQKQLHKNAADVGGKGGKKQRAQCSKGAKDTAARNELKKSNSLEEVSTTKLDGFKFEEDGNEQKEEEVVKPLHKPKIDAVQEKTKAAEVAVEKPKTEVIVLDKPKERKLWDNVEHSAFSRTQASDSVEASSEFRVVTKKKKTKKRRNSLSGTRHKPTNAASTACSKLDDAAQRRRTSSPVVPRRKSVCSVPHSEKSNDSSDVDSVHSLPAAAASSQRHKEAPISYADIARNAEKKEQPKKQFVDAKVGRDSSASDQSGSPKAQPPATVEPVVVTVNAQTQTSPPKAAAPPPDVHNIRSFPAIGKTAQPSVKVDKAINTPRPLVRAAVPQQSVPRVVQYNNVRNVKPQTVVASSQTTNNAPERDIKTDLSIIQANEMETVQYNSQMMPRMEIPDVQTIEKLNYMSQPGAHMPLHLQHHVVPPQHLHMAPPPQQRPPVVNQPPHHVAMMMPPPPQQQQQQPPEIYHPQPAYNPPPAVVAHHHHHHHHHSPHHPLAYPPQAYEGVAVAYVDPAYIPTQAPLNLHQQQPPVNHHPQPEPTTPRDKPPKWADQPQSQQDSRTKPKQKRYEKSQGHVDRRKDNARAVASPASSQPTAPHHHPTVTLYRRGDAQRRAAEPQPRPPRADDYCDRTNETTNDCASSGEEGQGAAGDRPPVVILSGAAAAAKDVPGIEFGFALNPDLVGREATTGPTTNACEIFDRYFRLPPDATANSYNHDKVVNYVGTAWEDVLNSDKAQYYASSPSN
ncbi:bromodomain-containing protein 4-like isoform X2 [Coccinella septempunctata]|uniref:bromodomain-containing protein 4-like isoform X2 n=1 Tax=Coccinella septempunctata TaxID=41139 RepID=UPI001D065127|nr:bromodomain-containing protein 4-like isoform X2 [Coccinella septempunctata]